ncbi:protein FAM234B [Oncorhynchus kisutch]|uniref:Family with sequence similarity 234 member B n=1 Tax=Oncorhynchus kisutch TaxID=8019 RepID=A0A8C7MCI3_ONCKI|nr:protein FAM234B [Oncorhynchus kisutch]XP_031690169.1 protein FAM234B [Oncorhynchus kisutch]
MAAALSRALKLPGKKGSELGEYDPLTQADSEDESEEDDLVLNYPRNGLGRGNCMGTGTSELRGSRKGRLVGDEEEAEEEEEDDDEWRERLPGKKRQEREEKGMQYWSQRETNRDEGVEDGGGLGASGGPGLGVSASADPDGKKAKVRGAIRAAFFLVPLVCAMLVVLLCAFLVPCQHGELDKRPQWEKELGDHVGGVTPPPLALWDVDNDSVEDVLIGVTQKSNNTHLSRSVGNNKEYSVVALSAFSGEVLWRRVLRDPVEFIQCGLQYEAHPSPLPAGGAALRALPNSAIPLSAQRDRASGPVCLLIESAHLTAVNGTTGKKLWSVAPGEIQSQAVSLPDLQGDSVPDLLIATLPADQVSDLSLLLLSGLTGALLGHPVTFNLTTFNVSGKLIGPLFHETQLGAYYILFGLGTVEAVSLGDIYTRATGKTPISPGLRLKDPGWEKLRKTNSSLIHISSGTEQVEFLVPLVAGLCNNHNSLDSISNLNSSRSDWVLVCGKLSSKLSVLREKDAHTEWTLTSSAIHSRPAPGQFNDDGIPDLLIQKSGAPRMRKVQVVDGASGRSLWETEFICPRLDLEGTSIMTSGQSAFLFWAGDPVRPPKNLTKTTVAPGGVQTMPVIRKLYMLHPAYPTILLELASTTDTILTAAVSYQEPQKDASYITVSSRPTSGLGPGSRVVKSTSLRAAITAGQIVRLGESSTAGVPVRPGVFEINKFFRRLTFKNH